MGSAYHGRGGLRTLELLGVQVRVDPAGGEEGLVAAHFDDAALVDGEGDPVDGAERAEVALEVLDEDGGSGHDRGESGDRAAEDDVIAFPADGGERVDETGAGV